MKSAHRPAAIFKKRFGYTMTELITVMGIIGMLSAIIIVGLRASRNRAAIGKAKSEMKFYAMTVNDYRARNMYSEVKWPEENDPKTCDANNLEFDVPEGLINEGLWKEGPCSKYKYYFDKKVPGGNGDDEVGIQWPGLDRVIQNHKSESENDSISGSDDLLVIVSESTDADRRNYVKNSLKKNLVDINTLD